MLGEETRQHLHLDSDREHGFLYSETVLTASQQRRDSDVFVSTSHVMTRCPLGSTGIAYASAHWHLSRWVGCQVNLQGRLYSPLKVMGCNVLLFMCMCVLGLEETSPSTSTSSETLSAGSYLTIFSVALETGEGNRIT